MSSLKHTKANEPMIKSLYHRRHEDCLYCTIYSPWNRVECEHNKEDMKSEVNLRKLGC